MIEYRGYKIFTHYGQASAAHYHYQFVPDGSPALIVGDCRGAKAGFATIKAAKADIDALIGDNIGAVLADVMAETVVRDGKTFVATQGGWKELQGPRSRDRDITEADMLAKRERILQECPEFNGASQVAELLGPYASTYYAWKRRTQMLEQRKTP